MCRHIDSLPSELPGRPDVGNKGQLLKLKKGSVIGRNTSLCQNFMSTSRIGIDCSGQLENLCVLKRKMEECISVFEFFIFYISWQI